MDWVILLLLVPAVLLPIVALYGFAGCGQFLDVGVPNLPPPTGLEAEADGTNQISLKWNAVPSFPTATYRVFRVQAGDVTESPINEGSETSATSLVDGPTGDPTKDLAEGTTFIYRVVAMFPQGVADSVRSQASSATTFPAAPTLDAERADATHVHVTWANNSQTASRFAIEFRVPPGQVDFTPVPTDPPGGVVAGLEYDHTLPAGTGDVDYRAFAIVPKGFQKSVPKEVRSPESNIKSVPVPAAPFQTVFNGNLTTDRANVAGFCIVQRFAANVLSGGGSKVGITLRGSTTGDLTIDSVFISQAAETGDPYDAAADPQLLASNVQIPANTTKVLDPVSYVLDATKPLLLAFDISTMDGQGNIRLGAAAAGIDAYGRAATAEAGLRDRTTGYTVAAGVLHLIEKIEAA